MNDYLVGIDVGSSKVCAAAGRIDKNGELSILGITSVNCRGLKKAVVVDIDGSSESIRECIEKLERMVDIEINEAYISLPGGISELVHNTGMVAISADDREIRKNDVERVLEATKLISISSDKEIIGIEPKQFIVDGYDNIKDPVGMSGLRLEVEADVLIAKTTVVTNLVKSVNKAGVDVKGICLQPKATSKVVLTEEEREMGTALVNVGAETMDITIIKNNNICFTSIIPLGGNNITNDISLGLKLPFQEAEKLKIKCANLIKSKIEQENKSFSKSSISTENSSIDYDFFNEIVEARVEELIIIIKKEIEKSGFYEQIRNFVFVGGGLSLINGLMPFAENLLKKTVKIGSPIFVGAANPIYAVAVGIVKDASDIFKQSEISNDFYEEENNGIWEQKSKKRYENTGVLTKVKNFLADFF
ncbi:cell division protein FtsA [Clostridium acidisoli DSM 12555]|jgi:cell division protein FtsA|uniref:Cell division protein FtsA n=1 Tax=Clostridium acidisoli DSM 12555 TaxID=1121291 RepID=A0A1W1XCH3_9CLOT|nr:cell division protein FtsA [Clostridium acidisoli]SMC21532.1 cell division protein FtsA [Clostridium acidisoli DSM 12555]